MIIDAHAHVTAPESLYVYTKPVCSRTVAPMAAAPSRPKIRTSSTR